MYEDIDIEDLIRFIARNTKERLKEDKKFAKNLKNKSKTMVIKLTDIDKTFAIEVDENDCELVNPKSIINPDVHIKTDKKTFCKIVEGRIRVTKQLATNKLKIKGGIRDMMLVSRMVKSESGVISNILDDYREYKS